MKIVVAVKQVATPDEDFDLADDERSIEPDALEWDLNEWDTFATEAALELRDAVDEGEVVAVKGGHIVTTRQMRSLSDRLQNSGVQITDDLHLVALAEEEYEAVMLFINHSCEPNVGFAGNVVLVAMRDVPAGEELTTDYALFDDYEGGMDCTCGRPTCRGRVDGRDWRRPDLQARYRGYFSWYLKRKMRDRTSDRSAGR